MLALLFITAIAMIASAGEFAFDILYDQDHTHTLSLTTSHRRRFAALRKRVAPDRVWPDTFSQHERGRCRHVLRSPPCCAIAVVSDTVCVCVCVCVRFERTR